MPNEDFLKNNMTERRRVEVWPVHQKHEGQRGTVKSVRERQRTTKGVNMLTANLRCVSRKEVQVYLVAHGTKWNQIGFFPIIL